MKARVYAYMCTTCAWMDIVSTHLPQTDSIVICALPESLIKEAIYIVAVGTIVIYSAAAAAADS